MTKKLTILLFSLVLSVSAAAQPVLPEALHKPVELALQRSKEISNKELNLKQTELERKSVKGKLIPRIEATAGYALVDNHLTVDMPSVTLPITGLSLFEGKTGINSSMNALHGGITAKSVLFSGMQISNGAKALEQKGRGDALLIETDKDALTVDVVNSFDMLRYIRASENLIDESSRRLQKEEERVNKAIENGLAVPYDREKLKLAQLELESNKINLEESKTLLLNKIAYLTGMDYEETAEVLYELEPIILDADEDAANRPELEALGAYKKAAQFLLKKEKGSFLPQAAAFGSVSYTSLRNMNSEFDIPDYPAALPAPSLKLNELTAAPNWMVGVVLKWELFGGMERRNKVRQAEINIEQLDNKLEDSRDKLNLQLLQKKAAYATAQKQIELAEQQVIVAGNSLNQAEKQYREGLITVTERLAAESDFVKAMQQKTEVLVNQRKAALEAAAAAGGLTQHVRYL